MTSSLDLLIKIKAENASAGKLTEVKNQINQVKGEMDKLREASKDINPKLEPDNARQMENAIKSLNKEMDRLEKEARDIENVNLTNLRDHFNGVATAARQATVVLGALTAGGVLVGKSLIDASSEAEVLATSLRVAFQQEKGADKLLEKLKLFANRTPYVTNEVIRAGVQLKAFGIETQKIEPLLTTLGDAAAGMGKDLSVAINAYLSASSGMYLRLKQFGVTAEQVKEQAGDALDGITDKTEKNKIMLEALEQVLKDKFGGGLQKASETMKGLVSTMQGEFAALKEQLGNELLPEMKSVVEETIAWIRYLKTISPETKKAVVVTGALTLGVLALGTAIAGTVYLVSAAGAAITTLVLNLGGMAVVVAGVTVAIEALIAVGGLLTTILGTIVMGIATFPAMAVTVGSVTNEIIKYHQAIAELEGADIEKQTQAHAKALREIQEIIPDVTNGMEAFSRAQEQGFENIAKMEGGMEAILSLSKLLAHEQLQLTTYRSDEKKKLDELKEAYDALIASGVEESDSRAVALDMEIKQQEAVIEKIDTQIDGYREARGEINENTKAIEEQKNAIEESSDILQKSKTFALFENIENQFKSFGKSVDDSISKWDDFERAQKLALAKGEILQQDYYDNIARFLADNEELLKWDSDKKIDIETKYYEGIGKIAEDAQKEKEDQYKADVKAYEDAIKEKEKIEKEEAKAREKAAKERLKKQKEEAKERAEAEKAISSILYSSTDAEDNAYLQKIKKLNEDYEKYAKYIDDKNKLDQWYAGERQRYDDEYVKKAEEQRNSLLEANYNLQMKLLELQKASATTEEQRRQLDLQGLELLKQRVVQARTEASGLYERAMAGETLNEQELERLNTYLEIGEEFKEQATLLGVQNQYFQEQYGLLEENANMTALQVNAQDEVTESINKTNNSLLQQGQIRQSLAESSGAGQIKDFKLGQIQTGIGLGDLGSVFVGPTVGGGGLCNLGFDNPAHDKIAWQAGEKIVERSISDMISNLLSGMVSSVTKIVNSSSSYSSQKIQDNSRHLSQNLNLTINGTSKPATSGVRQDFNRGLDRVKNAYGVF